MRKRPWTRRGGEHAVAAPRPRCAAGLRADAARRGPPLCERRPPGLRPPSRRLLRRRNRRGGLALRQACASQPSGATRAGRLRRRGGEAGWLQERIERAGDAYDRGEINERRSPRRWSTRRGRWDAEELTPRAAWARPYGEDGDRAERPAAARWPGRRPTVRSTSPSASSTRATARPSAPRTVPLQRQSPPLAPRLLRRRGL